MNRIQIEKSRTYYELKLNEHGDSALGADWNGDAARDRRLLSFLTGIKFGDSVLEFGCGTGRLYELLLIHDVTRNYQGFDILENAIALACEKHGNLFTAFIDDVEPADHVIASGLFNVKQDTDVAAWQEYIASQIDLMLKYTNVSLRFNLLGPEPRSPRDDLYYANLNFIWALLKDRGINLMNIQSVPGLIDANITATRGD